MSLGVIALRINYSLIFIISFILLYITFLQVIDKARSTIILTLLRQAIELVSLIVVLSISLGVESTVFAQLIELSLLDTNNVAAI